MDLRAVLVDGAGDGEEQARAEHSRRVALCRMRLISKKKAARFSVESRPTASGWRLSSVRVFHNKLNNKMFHANGCLFQGISI
jgi:hypothetical protein